MSRDTWPSSPTTSACCVSSRPSWRTPRRSPCSSTLSCGQTRLRSPRVRGLGPREGTAGCRLGVRVGLDGADQRGCPGAGGPSNDLQCHSAPMSLLPLTCHTIVWPPVLHSHAPMDIAGLGWEGLSWGTTVVILLCVPGEAEGQVRNQAPSGE